MLLSDEGFGVHVAQKLYDLDFPPEVEVVEGGTDGFGLMAYIVGADRLILIDAVKGGGVPGSLYRFDVNECPPFPDLFKTSVHQVSILEIINLSGVIGAAPRTTIIGIEPKTLEIGMGLSPEIEAKIPRVIRLVQDEVAAALGCSAEEKLRRSSTPSPCSCA